MKSLKVLSHPRFETPTGVNKWHAVKDTSHDLNFCFPYQKTRCPCESDKNVKRQLIDLVNFFLIQNDF